MATKTAAIVLLTPDNFYHFRRPKFNFQPLSFTFEACGKKLAETKIVASVNVKKIKAKKGCGMAQLVVCRAAVWRPRVRISARHPSGDPLPELAAMKKLEWNSANVMNE